MQVAVSAVLAPAGSPAGSRPVEAHAQPAWGSAGAEATHEEGSYTRLGGLGLAWAAAPLQGGGPCLQDTHW